ncbi:MAG: sulfate ABC transporter permease subunit CysT [Thermoguttaceae bacterium]
MQIQLKRQSVLPGFGLTIGFTLLYLSLIVLIPLSGLFLKSATLSWSEFWKTVSDPRVVASYRLTFGASLVGALINAVFGLIVAWVLVRYSFPGKKIVDALVDLPFAMPTAVSGIALTMIYSQNGWIGGMFSPHGWLARSFSPTGWIGGMFEPGTLGSHICELCSSIREYLNIKIAYTPLGVIVALTFIGLPFVVRTLQPALEDMETGVEEAAASLGASRWQTFIKVILPMIFPALLTGFALAFARALGEYGSVIFISGNLPMKTEITPLLIYTKLEEYNYAQAAAIAVVTLVASFAVLLFINLVQWWSRRYAA